MNINDCTDKDIIIGSREIFAVGEIDDEFYTKLMRNISLLENIKNSPITIYLSSPGGDISAALGIYDRILQLLFEVKITVFGEACSAASIILQAADIRLVSNHSLLMIHDLSSECSGKVDDMKSIIKVNNILTSYMIDIYVEKSSMSVKQLKYKFSGADWYLTSNEAIQLGFADGRI